MTALTLSELHTRLFISVTDVAAILEVDERTVRRAIEAGQIPAIRVGTVIRIPTARFLPLCGIDPEDGEREPASSRHALAPASTTKPERDQHAPG